MILYYERSNMLCNSLQFISLFETTAVVRSMVGVGDVDAVTGLTRWRGSRNPGKEWRRFPCVCLAAFRRVSGLIESIRDRVRVLAFHQQFHPWYVRGKMTVFPQMDERWMRGRRVRTFARRHYLHTDSFKSLFLHLKWWVRIGKINEEQIFLIDI